MSLENRTAIVTGAARGIGFAAARRFAAEGARTVLVDRDAEAGEAAAATIRAGGGEALFVACDVTVADQVGAAIDAAAAAFGTPTIVLNNAGVHQAVPLLDMTEAEFTRVMSINVNSVFLFSQSVARAMVTAGVGGAIVNVSSVNARMATPNATAYSASKGAIVSFTAASAVALAPHGIRVNAIGPGTVATELTTGMAANAELADMVRSRTPLGRMADPEEIASVAYFLASDDASYVTGQTLYVDGGRSALSFMVAT